MDLCWCIVAGGGPVNFRKSQIANVDHAFFEARSADEAHMMLSNWPCGTHCTWNGSLSVFRTRKSAAVTVENLFLRVSCLFFVSSAQAEGFCLPQEMTTRASSALCAQRRKHAPVGLEAVRVCSTQGVQAWNSSLVGQRELDFLVS